MNLAVERRYILGCLAGTPHHSVVSDPTIGVEIRSLLATLEGADDQGRGEVVAKCSSLYDAYGPGVWKAILDYAFLLHTTSDAAQLFGGVLAKLEKDLRDHQPLARAVVNELGWLSTIPYDFTSALIRLTLERVAKAAGNVLAELIENTEVDSGLRLMAVEAACRVRCMAAYRSILAYLLAESLHSTAESYSRVISRIMAAYATTGTAGLMLAVEAFERGKLGPQGSRLLASFKGDFATWFLTQPPYPSLAWARVLANGWHLADSADHRNNLLTLLLEEWCTDSAIAELVRRILQQHLRGNRYYLSPASKHLRAKVLSFARLDPGEHGQGFRRALNLAIAGTHEEWMTWTADAPIDRASGSTAAEVFLNGTAENKQRILEWVENVASRANYHESFFRYLTQPDHFKTLHPDAQLRIVRSSLFERNVRSARVEAIIAARTELRDDVVKALAGALTAILRSVS